MDSPYLTVEELAALFRVPRSRVYEWTREVGPDAIPSYQAGKRIVFDPDEVQAWFRETKRRGLYRLHRASRVVSAGRRRSAPDNELEGRGKIGSRKPAWGPDRSRRTSRAPVDGAALVPSENIPEVEE